MISGPSARDVQQVTLSLIDFLQIGVVAYRLDPPSAGTWVRWSEGYGSASPWGEVGYQVGMKPISTPGCWRVVPEGGRMEDGVVVVIRPA